MTNDHTINGETMNFRLQFLIVFLLLLFLAACTPAETTIDSPTMAPEAADTRADAAAPATPTPIPVQPTETQSPTFTATPTKLTAEIVPEAPTKPAPTSEIVPMPQDPPAEPPTDPYSLELIDKAKTDLAQRLGLPKEEIALDYFEYLTWPNASLGCPQPGIAYADVLVDGYLIMLRVGLGIYNYHGASDGKGPFLCEGGIGTKIIVPPPSGSLDR